jgi:hypothetical protein
MAKYSNMKGGGQDFILVGGAAKELCQVMGWIYC